MTATSIAPQPILRSEYTPSDFQIETVDLHFCLEEQATLVRSRLAIRRCGDPGSDLVLTGEEMTLHSVTVDGETLQASEYTVSDEALTLHNPSDEFVLEVEVEIAPASNTSLSGLYVSGGNYCTQCEAEGFRRITYFLDRPDVMARYTVTIEGDKNSCPVMLSNGNRLGVEELEGGRQRVRWEDPFPKPSYLFALVAGNLACHEGSFTTSSGREIKLELWVAEEDLYKCPHALTSLQNAMRWDEDTFGLEYDLDLYMIVAVSDFNMGAMENKGLNVFNSKCVLAAPETATDDDFESIESIIGHEYFHNWTGNRVTCRDWFQLTLKEGLTVFRDQRFSADMGSEAVVRIGEVRLLRAAQFPEDAGPMSHPIRPESYIAMDNFYTATVYNKGAEVIRMMHTLLGAEAFRRGMDLYFERHDGQAVTCDDFRAAMASAGNVDLAQFEGWYTQAGTPHLKVTQKWNAAEGRLTLTFVQKTGDHETPLHIPVRMGLVGADGADCPLFLEGDPAGSGPTTRVLELRQASQEFTFTGLAAKPLPSVLRGFSAPVVLEHERSDSELAFLLAHDSDSFNRWDAGQELYTGAVLQLAKDSGNGRSLALPAGLCDAFKSVLTCDNLDGSLRALALSLPSERELASHMSVIDPEHLHIAREYVRKQLASLLYQPLLDVYEACAPTAPYGLDGDEIHRRRLRGCVLAYLSCLEDEHSESLAFDQFTTADNMTESQSALTCLLSHGGERGRQALNSFYDKWKDDALVIDKWFTVQAACTRPGAVERMQALVEHPDFSLLNPNRARSVLGIFPTANPAGFHAVDGSGYTFLADQILAIDTANPQLAARLVGAFLLWKKYSVNRQELMSAQLARMNNTPGLSKNTGEIITRALG